MCYWIQIQPDDLCIALTTCRLTCVDMKSLSKFVHLVWYYMANSNNTSQIKNHIKWPKKKEKKEEVPQLNFYNAYKYDWQVIPHQQQYSYSLVHHNLIPQVKFSFILIVVDYIEDLFQTRTRNEKQNSKHLRTKTHPMKQRTTWESNIAVNRVRGKEHM